MVKVVDYPIEIRELWRLIFFSVILCYLKPNSYDSRYRLKKYNSIA